MDRYATRAQWGTDSTVYPLNDRLIALPDGYSGTGGTFPWKLCDGVRSAQALPWSPAPAFFLISSPSGGNTVVGPIPSIAGALAIFTDATGRILGNGPLLTDFATSAQGALADSALQPGDPLTDLSAGAAPATFVPVSDGAGNIVWSPVSGAGAGDVMGPGTSTDNALVRWDGVTGTIVQNSGVVVDDSDNVSGLGTLNGSTLPAAPGTLVTLGAQLTVFSSGAATAGQVPEADGAGAITWQTPTATGDVVGPASSTDNNVPQWDGVTGKLLKDGLGTSIGTNGAADAGKIVLFNAGGGLYGVIPTGSATGVQGSSDTGDGVQATSNSADGIHATSGTGKAVNAIAGGAEPAVFANNQGTGYSLEVLSQSTGIALSVTQNTPATDIAQFTDGVDTLTVGPDGGLAWVGGGDQTTADNLPVFGALTKGVVPAAGAVPAATNFLTETGVFAVPAAGITELTGDVTAGPGSGSQAATIAPDVVDNTKLADMAGATFKGRRFGLATGDPMDLDSDFASVILDQAADPFVRTSALPAAGITELTGDGTAGPGSGSQALTLATVNANVGPFGSATQVGTFTANAKGLITAAGNTTVTPAVGSVTGLGTGVGAALAVNVGSAGAPVVNGGALGTPSSGTATNLTGTAAGLTAGTVTTNADLTGPVTSVGNATAIANSGVTAGTYTAPLITIGADGRITAAASLNQVFVLSGSDFTTSSATPVDITGYTLTLTDPGTYNVLINSYYTSPNAATGVGVTLTITGSPSLRAFRRELFTSATVAIPDVIGVDDAGTVPTTVGGINTPRPAIMTGVVKTNGSNCVIQVRAVRGGSANTITILQGSNMVAQKIA